MVRLNSQTTSKAIRLTRNHCADKVSGEVDTWSPCKDTHSVEQFYMG